MWSGNEVSLLWALTDFFIWFSWGSFPHINPCAHHIISSERLKVERDTLMQLYRQFIFRQMIGTRAATVNLIFTPVCGPSKVKDGFYTWVECNYDDEEQGYIPRVFPPNTVLKYVLESMLNLGRRGIKRGQFNTSFLCLLDFKRHSRTQMGRLSAPNTICVPEQEKRAGQPQPPF